MLYTNIIKNNNIVFSDSFGSIKYNSNYGYKGLGSDVIIGKNNILKTNGLLDYHFIRGIYCNGDKLIVGSSFHGKRSNRFKGNASLIQFKNFNFEKFEKLLLIRNK